MDPKIAARGTRTLVTRDHAEQDIRPHSNLRETESCPYPQQMIALQEELDWQCYRLYGLIEEDLTCPETTAPRPRPASLRDRARPKDGSRRNADNLV